MEEKRERDERYSRYSGLEFVVGGGGVFCAGDDFELILQFSGL